MRRALSVVVGMSLIVLSLAVSAPADEAPAASNPAAAGAEEVTIKGMMMLEEACTLKPAKDADKTLVLFALEGTPEVAVALDAIMKENWPGDSMDGEQARNLNEAWGKRLKYYITPGELTTKNLGSCKWGNPQRAVTGIVSEKDGRKWITPSKIFDQYPDRKPVTLKYPDKMLAPDKPIKTTGKDPLILKVTETLSLKCILLPRGAFLFMKPFYVVPRWQDEFPRLITLTKPFYMAEIPVTQEMYEAVMGKQSQHTERPPTPGPECYLRRRQQVLQDSVGEERPNRPSARGSGMGIRGPRGHIQSATGCKIQGPEERRTRKGRVSSGEVQTTECLGTV